MPFETLRHRLGAALRGFVELALCAGKKVVRRQSDARAAASFAQKLRLTLLAIFLIGASIAGLAYWKSVQSVYLLERSRLAHEVLQGYLDLSSATYELYKVIGLRVLAGERGIPFTAALSSEAELVGGIEAKVAKLRKLIADEVAFAGNAPGENEKEEFTRLAAIENRVAVLAREHSRLAARDEASNALDTWKRIAAVLDETLDKDFRRLIKEGIADEVEEVEDSDAKARSLIARMRAYVVVAVGLGLLVSVVGASLLVRSVKRDLGALTVAVADFASGKPDTRVAIASSDEFGLLARRFNAMAAELDVRRKAADADRATLERKIGRASCRERV